MASAEAILFPRLAPWIATACGLAMTNRAAASTAKQSGLAEP